MDMQNGLRPFPGETEKGLQGYAWKRQKSPTRPFTKVPLHADREASMKVKCMGAARTVTGSCFILEAAGRRFAIDCGMHQGNAEIDKRNWDVDIYDPHAIEFMLMTHAHMDHSGFFRVSSRRDSTARST